MENGHYLEAKKEFETAIRIDPDSMEPVINLAKLNMNHFERNHVALALFKKALRLAPESAYTCKGLGDIYNKLEEYEKADHFYTVAVKRMPFLTSAINNLAITKIFLNKKDEAIVVFKYGIKIDPTHADLNTNLAKLYADKKMFTQAVKTLEIFLAKNGEFKPGYDLLEKIKQQKISDEFAGSGV
jgi:tetratricopeptide (TPR) repeat protein